MLIALVVTAGALLASQPVVPVFPNGPSTFYTLDSDDSVDMVAECLLDLGWRGKPDGMPRVYAPLSAIRICGGDVGYQRHV